jgi:hypothetical protein
VLAPRARHAVCALLAAGLVAATPASAATAKDDLWATVNVCNPASQPGVFGVRGSMPGTGKKGEMFMRFRVQWYKRSAKRWRTLRGDDTDTGFKSVGSSRFNVRQSGASFVFVVPPKEGVLRLRGYVQFEWRAKGEVVRKAKRFTEAGHKSVTGADPPGYSARRCVLR